MDMKSHIFGLIIYVKIYNVDFRIKNIMMITKPLANMLNMGKCCKVGATANSAIMLKSVFCFSRLATIVLQATSRTITSVDCTYLLHSQPIRNSLYCRLQFCINKRLAMAESFTLLW